MVIALFIANGGITADGANPCTHWTCCTQNDERGGSSAGRSSERLHGACNFAVRSAVHAAKQNRLESLERDRKLFSEGIRPMTTKPTKAGFGTERIVVAYCDRRQRASDIRDFYDHPVPAYSLDLALQLYCAGPQAESLVVGSDLCDCCGKVNFWALTDAYIAFFTFYIATKSGKVEKEFIQNSDHKFCLRSNFPL